jgi:hypothetical protein
MTEERFDWNSDDTVVIREQPAIAVQGNDSGDLMIRQQGQYCVSEDQFIDVRRENVLAICDAMLREAGLHRFMIVEVDEIGLVGSGGNAMRIPGEDLEKLDRIAEDMRLERNEGRRPVLRRTIPASAQSRAPRDPTAALRKQRQRQKERQEKAAAVTRDTVTSDRESVTETASPPTADGEPQPQLKLAHC